MAMGTKPTPIQLTARYSEWAPDNILSIIGQLRRAGVDVPTIVKFESEVIRIRDELGVERGQIEPISQAAEAIGAELVWRS